MSDELDLMTDINMAVFDGNNVVILFTAPSWCAPCRAVKPHWEGLPALLPDITFYTIDIDDYPATSASFAIQSVPTIIQYKDLEQRRIESRTLLKLKTELESPW